MATDLAFCQVVPDRPHTMGMATVPVLYRVCQVVPDQNIPIMTSNNNTAAVTQQRNRLHVSLNTQLVHLGHGFHHSPDLNVTE